MTEQKNKTELKTENPATPETQLICQKNCSICQSGHIREIHELWKNKKKYTEIMEFLKSKYGIEVSKSALSRHFKKYTQRQRSIAAGIVDMEMTDKATEIAIHQQAIVKLINRAIYYIDNSLVVFDISDLEKLFKIRHQILEGKFEGENNLFAFFKTAENKYNVHFSQQNLNIPPPEPPTSQNRKQNKRAEDAERC